MKERALLSSSSRLDIKHWDDLEDLGEESSVRYAAVDCLSEASDIATIADLFPYQTSAS